MASGRLSREEFVARAQGVRLLVLDVDGVLSDGSIVYDDRGMEIKRFHVRDGFGIRCWQRAGHRVAVISGRYSHTTAIRCRELGIRPVIQSSPMKGPAFRWLLARVGCEASACCVVGDDLPDLPILLSAGIGVAVGDADPTVRARAPWVTESRGGRGAVREVVELLLSAQGSWQDTVDFYSQSTLESA